MSSMSSGTRHRKLPSVLLIGTALAGAAVLTVGTPAAAGQSGAAVSAGSSAPGGATKRLDFDIVSVKPDDGSSGAIIRVMNQPDGYSITAPLKMILSTAYGIREDLISGAPKWATDMRYDIAAKVAGADVEAFGKLGKEQRNAMLQAVLADRFKLKAHVEAKELPIYELVIAKSGPKLEEDKPQDPAANGGKGPGAAGGGGMMSMRPGLFQGQGIPLSVLVEVLSRELHRNIVDKTGLTGKYDVKLRYTPDEGPQPMLNGQPDTSAPSIFTALEEQLGLKLNPAKGPVDTLVVDQVEQPSAN